MAMANIRLAMAAGSRRYTKLGRKETIGRAAAAAIEALESRTLLSVDPALQLDMALPYLPDTPKAIAPSLPDGVLAGPLSVPALHSYPTAAVKIYLDFDGYSAMTWGAYSVPATPAYSIDTDPNSFSATELNNIQEIWQRVSEKYSPFNVDVTTVDPGNTNDLQTVVAVIGGGGGWLGSLAGGVAYVGGFSNTAPNQVWIFPDNLGAGFPKYVGEATAHEVGHSFGLYHQSLYSGTTLVQDYYSGDTYRAPIMGNSYSSARGLWWYGTSTSSTTMQDDLAVIASSTNGFGYKADDVGDTTGTAGTLTVVNGNISASAIIGNTADADYYILDIPVDGTMSINLNGPNGAMLDSMLELRFSDGSFWFSNDSTPSTTEYMGGSYTAGRYYLVVRSHGGYGDIGQYTISGTVPSVPLPNAPSGLSTTVISSSQINLSWTDSSNNEAGFRIERSLDGVTWSGIASVGANVVTYSNTGLLPGTTYYYRVSSYRVWGAFNPSNISIATTLANRAPTDLTLSPTSVPENQPIGTTVGTFSTVDPDAGDTFTYTLVTGVGSTDNGLFTISGNALKTAAVFDFETQSTYSIRVRTTDAGGLFIGRVFTITVTFLPPNRTPTDISLSASSIAENQPVGTAVGTLSTTDPDAGNTFTYSLVSGAGSTDNASFSISGGTLQTAAMFDYETKSSYSIRLRTTDQGGLWFEKAFTVTVTNVNETPTDIGLSASSVAENQPQVTPVGTFSTTDPDAGNTFTYTFAGGAGSTDNVSFSISGATLRTSGIFDYETKNSYSIRVRTTDQGGLWFEKVFTISVTNLNEAPTNIILSASSVPENQPAGTAVGTLSATDPDAGNTFTYSLVSGIGSTDNVSFTVSGNQLLTAAMFNYEVKNSYSIRLRATDQGGSWYDKVFTITVTDVVETAPTDIALSASSVAENQPTGTAIGTFSSADADVGDTFAYTLVSGAGSANNSSFTISGNSLRTAAIFDYEVKSSYSIRVRTTDLGGLWFEKVFTITVIDANDPPTNVTLSASTVAENQPAGTAIGSFSTTDVNAGDTFMYSLVDGTGSTDNSSFQIVGNQLQSAQTFDYEIKRNFSIRVRTTDQGGLSFENSFAIAILNANESPTDLSITPGNISENLPVGTAAGNFSTTDPDFLSSFSYSLVPGDGSDDNASFTISGAQLVTATTFNAASKSSYTIRVRTTDGGGLWVERVFPISITTDGVPAVVWSSYIGGNNSDCVWGTRSDASGNTWVVGTTVSAGWVTNGFDTSYGGSSDAFVAKINADGTLAWSTYLGGSNLDYGYGIALDANGNAWVAGSTSSSGWVSGGFDTTLTGTQDAFVAKINADGTLAWSSYLGGYGTEKANGIALDAQGNAWVVGITAASNWASGGFDTSFNGGAEDAFVAKINANGTLAWSSYLGGFGDDYGESIAVDASGNACVTGFTYSSGWVSGGFDTTLGGSIDGFVARINANGTLAWTSYVGGSNDDYAAGIAAASDGSVWVTGNTYGGGWATGGFDTTYNGGVDAFVVKIAANGTLAWSSYLGGSGDEEPVAISTDQDGNAWITGDTSRGGWATGSFDGSFGGSTDAFVAMVNADGTFGWSSFLGGIGTDNGRGISVDAQGNAWVTGGTDSAGWVTGGFDTSPNGGSDGFVAKVRLNRAPNDASLSSATVGENAPPGTVVGSLSNSDPDSIDVPTYSLVTGAGDTDNVNFTISGDQLLTAASFDFEAKSSYSIRVRTTDQGGLWFEKTFTINVLNVAEVVPTITSISTDTGSSSSDGITSDPTLLINGASEPGMTITVYRGGVLAGSTSADGSGNWVFDYTGTSLADGSYNFTATASDTLAHTTAASAPYAVTVDGTAPALPTSSINDGAVQRSMVKKLTLSFGEKVVLDTGAVTVKKSDGSEVPDTTLLVSNPSGDQKNYVLSFSGIGVVGGSLADGIYDLSVAAAGVQDLAGNALGGNFSQRFHRLYGDYDGNKTVNNGDYFWFKQTFGKSVGTTGFLDLCDYDANGTVNNGDYFQFKKRFGVVYSY